MGGMKTLMDLIKTKVEVLPKNETFLSELKQTVSKLNPIRPSSTHFRPSSLNCDRMIYFDKVQAPKDPTPREYGDIRITETGTSSHEQIQYYVSKMQECGFDCEWVDVGEYVKEHNLTDLEVVSKKDYETKLFDKKHDISFLCDGIIKYKGEYFILEIKTEIDSKGLKRDSADDKHRFQSVCYALCLDIRRIMWLYEERNLCTPKTFITEVSDEEITNMLLKFETVETAVKNLIPPPRPDTHKYCAYCSYKNECKKYS